MMTHRKALFAKHYALSGNATAAAKEAGYSAKTAHTQGPRLLDDVEVTRLVVQERERHARALELNADEIREHVRAIATFDPSQLYDAKGRLIPLHRLPKQVRIAVESYQPSGKDGRARTVKPHSKTAGLRLAADILGMVRTQVRIGGDADAPPVEVAVTARPPAEMTLAELMGERRKLLEG
jgi:phage terminase small subunit